MSFQLQHFKERKKCRNDHQDAWNDVVKYLVTVHLFPLTRQFGQNVVLAIAVDITVCSS